MSLINGSKSKKGDILIKAGFNFNLKETSFVAESISEIEVLVNKKEIIFLEIKVNLSCLQKLSKKEIKAFMTLNVEQKKAAYKIVDVEARKRHLTAISKRAADSDIFKLVKEPFILYIDESSPLCMYIDRSTRKIWLDEDLSKISWSIEAIYTITIDNNGHVRNTNHSEIGIYNRAILQKNIYILASAYINKRNTTVWLPACLANEKTFLPY